MDYLYPLVYFIALMYLGIISIETTMIVYDNPNGKIIYNAAVKTKDGIIKQIEVITNKLTKIL
jgi:hypothetical protein